MTGSFKSIHNLSDEQRESVALRKRNKELEKEGKSILLESKSRYDAKKIKKHFTQ